MKPEMWAVLTAICWAVGSVLEKKGVKLGEFTPVMGTTIRTVVSLTLLLVLSFSFWGEVKTAGLRPVLLIAVGGGVIAGCLGIVFLYSALRDGQISIVLTIAFCLTPVIGAILGCLFLEERLGLVQILGIVMCVAGAALVTLFNLPAVKS
ncbi:MAG: EamA family transporter [Pirellulaceae bacterium]|nr:EamA family transporter [Pirellulaceae bacterium]